MLLQTDKLRARVLVWPLPAQYEDIPLVSWTCLTGWAALEVVSSCHTSGTERAEGVYLPTDLWGGSLHWVGLGLDVQQCVSKLLMILSISFSFFSF